MRRLQLIEVKKCACAQYCRCFEVADWIMQTLRDTMCKEMMSATSDQARCFERCMKDEMTGFKVKNTWEISDENPVVAKKWWKNVVFIKANPKKKRSKKDKMKRKTRQIKTRLKRNG